jgi:hypothetical protein
MDARLTVATETIDTYQPLLCPDWQLKVKFGNMDYPNNPAKMSRHLFERKALIEIDYRIKLAEVKQCVLHEIAHLIVGDYENMVTTLVDKVLSDAPTDVAFRELFGDALERVCDTIANAFVGIRNG